MVVDCCVVRGDEVDVVGTVFDVGGDIVMFVSSDLDVGAVYVVAGVLSV